VPRLGLTATPFRANEEESLSLWERAPLLLWAGAEALADGVVVPFTVEPWRGGEATMDDACAWMIQEAVQQGWAPLVVDADSIQDAELFAKRVSARKRGSARRPSTPGWGAARSRSAIERLVKGQLDALVHVALLKGGRQHP
jgi:hypothetical protein